MTTTPRLALPLIGDHSQKHIVLNESLMRLESLVQAHVLSRNQAVQPASPADGDSYILPSGAAGAAWSLWPTGTFLRAESGTWEPVAFPEGGIVHIGDDNALIVRCGGDWHSLETLLDIAPPVWPLRGTSCLTPLGAGAPAASAVASGTLYMLPVAVPYALSLSALSLRVATAIGTARLGLYRDVNSAPGGLIAESGDLTLTAGTVSAAVVVNLEPGLYWLAALFSATPSVMCHTSQALGIDAATFDPVNGYSRSLTYGALPSDEIGQSYTAATMPCPTVVIG